MTETHSSDLARVDTGSGLIAWLSVGLLAGAFGHTLDTAWQPIWAEAGAFGLTAAFGLGRLERTRFVLGRLAFQQRQRQRMEGGLSRMQEHSATLESVGIAARRLAEHANRRTRGKSSPAVVAIAPAQFNYTCELTPVAGEQAIELLSHDLRMAGCVRQISALSVCVEHDETFNARLALLTFELDKQEKLGFVVDIMWTQPAGEKFTSTGTIIAVGIPGEQPAEQASEQAVGCRL